MTDLWPWSSLVVLGAFHGLNPAMGWLFAVALGFQERSRAAVLRALPAIAVGHEASVAVAVLLVSGAQLVVAPGSIRPVGAAALILFGAYKIARPGSHPRWVGMRVSRWDLVVWSFLMSSAHGAGLMLFPVLVGLSVPGHAEDFGGIDPLAATLVQDLAAVLLHTAAMLLTMLVVSLVVYEKLGVGVLRRAWLNLDAFWAVVVVGAGLVTLFT